MSESSDVRISSPGGEEMRPDGPANLYFLPGSVHRLHFKSKTGSFRAGASLRLDARSDEGEIVALLLVSARP